MTDSSTQDRIALPARIPATGVVAVGRGLDPASVVRIGEGLVAGGVGAFEVLLGTSGALESVAALHERFGDVEGLVVGAGAIYRESDAEDAVAAGAEFLAMPVTDLTLVAWAAKRGIPSIPGAMTPTEAFAGWTAGAAAIGLFPASVVGPTFIHELHGAFTGLPIIPAGGITVDTAPSFILAGAVAVGLGHRLIGDGDPAGVAERSRRVVAVIRAAREGGRAE